MSYIQKSYFKKYGNKDNSMEGKIIEDINYLVEKSNNPEPALPYKVYTALLTQSGDSDSPYYLQAGALNIGNTYMIYQESPGMDFTNIGAPNNNLYTYFVATGTTPNSWGLNEGSADILYSNNGWPTVNILENTIGTLAFIRQTDGYYSIVSQDYLFTVNKTWYNITPGDLIYSNLYQEMVYGNTTEILMYTSAGGTLADGVLNNTPIEIRVYN